MSRAKHAGRRPLDADRLFHREWLGLAQPIEGLVFSVPALAEAQIAPAPRPEITAAIRALLVETERGLALRSTRHLFETFLGYSRYGIHERDELPPELAFYAPESRQEIRPSFAILRVPSVPAEAYDILFEEFEPAPTPAPASDRSRYVALVWDLADDAPDATLLDLDAPEDTTGPWRYPPTAKLERLLRHTGVPIGFLSNGRHLRLVYAPPGEATSHLTFRWDDLADPAGRPLALAFELLFHARRTYTADPRFTFEGLLEDSRKRQAEVTEELAQQVFEAVERLLEGFEAAAARDCVGDRPDWLRAAMEEGQVYGGVLNVVLRLVFLLYAEDRSLLPVDHPTYAAHLSVLGLYERLSADAGAHPESMHQRFGAYGALVSLFRAVYFGVRHEDLRLPPRQGRLFDPSAFPFLEGGLPDWTAAVTLPEDRAAVRLPTVDDRAVHEVLHRLIVLDGQRISYRDLSVEQIGAVYESLMGFRVERMTGPAVRLGSASRGQGGHWLEVAALRAASKTERDKLLADRCGLTKSAIAKVSERLARAAEDESDDDALADALLELAGARSERQRHRARTGQLVLQPTASRRSTGSHYTPRSLSEKVVRRTLEPVIACLGEAPRAEQILQLKVCDPAMGSGAFLVEACRFLGEAVVQAWRRSGELPAMVEAHGDATLHAKRLVAQRCLYGVDKNAAAVELAKLSLWLETLSGDKAFTFLDHVLRHGDSLVGLDLDQIRAFHWAPDEQLSTIRPLVDAALAEVREHREAIHALADDESDYAQREKRRLLELADLAMARVKLVADACVGAFFAEAKAKAREAERQKRLAVVERYLAGDESAAGELEEWAREIRGLHAPFHWHLELPEVFFLERADPLAGGERNGAAFVDAFVGNPPFMGKNGIAETGGPGYLDWLQTVHEGAHGNADLSAHFFRRAASLLGAHGTIGLIATNTISQGDTRATGLQHLVTQRGFVIFDATRSMLWPGEAAVSVSLVHLAKGAPRTGIAARYLDGKRVDEITSRLSPGAERADAEKLVTNDSVAFIGYLMIGAGFELTESEYEAMLGTEAGASAVVFPLVNGEDVTATVPGSRRRYAIDFGTRELAEAKSAAPNLLARIERLVKPVRDTNARANYRDRWWLYAEPRPGLRDALGRLDRCLVRPFVSKHHVFAFVDARSVIAAPMVAITSRSSTTFLVLQSRIHECWARLLSSSMKNDLRYSASDSFETFPFPQPDPRTVIPELEEIAQRLYDARAAYMLETQQGLTQTYNKLKDPACEGAPILHLRRLHEDMDRAVLAAYGWSDLQVPPFCPSTPEEQTALEAFQDQVIDRLFVLNAERAAEERRLGAATKQGTAAKPKKTKPKKAAQSSLFDDND